MDGTQAKKIITEDLVWPNALAIDYFAERLYWADAFRDVIEFIRFLNITIILYKFMITIIIYLKKEEFSCFIALFTYPKFPHNFYSNL